MEPSNAVSLASSIIQLVEYSAKVAHKGKVGGLHGSDANTLKESTLLDDAIVIENEQRRAVLGDERAPPFFLASNTQAVKQLQALRRIHR